MDEDVTIGELVKSIVAFRRRRDWKGVDTPKDLAISISVEAAELLELFQWKTDREVGSMLQDRKSLSTLSNELADVVIYCIALADIMKIDLSHSIQSKLKKIARRHPSP
jgi:NTP pyrophosphatase (non-canonical NTP hydrolase)